MKLWGGRFSCDTEKNVDDFNSSIRFDSRLFRHDIRGSVAHAKMLGKCGIISQDEADLLIKTLGEILLDIEAEQVQFEVNAEDIHMNIEKILIERIGETGKKLHTARSRNDQVALDIRMYIKDEINEIIRILTNFEEVLINLSENNLETIMPGYTHLQRAQPITLAHHLMAYFQMFKRDIERLNDSYKRVDVMPLGSGALAGTTYPIDRKFVANELGFAQISFNSLDAVSDRDFAIELSACLSIIMMHFSRFAEEIIMWSSSEFGFIELDDAYSTGSSIMPQKKNPDVAELARGKTGRVYGNLIALLTVMKGLPLAYNKDMQEDKEAIFDSIDTVKMCIPIFSKMIETAKFKVESMYKATCGGFTNATDIADYLVKRGMAFRDAHSVVGHIVCHCIGNKKEILELSMAEFKEFSDIFENDVFEDANIKNCVENRKVEGGPAKEALCEAIDIARKFIKDNTGI